MKKVNPKCCQNKNLSGCEKYLIFLIFRHFPLKDDVTIIWHLTWHVTWSVTSHLKWHSTSTCDMPRNVTYDICNLIWESSTKVYWSVPLHNELFFLRKNKKNIKCSKLPETQNKLIKVFFNFSRGRSELRKISMGS